MLTLFVYLYIWINDNLQKRQAKAICKKNRLYWFFLTKDKLEKNGKNKSNPIGKIKGEPTEQRCSK